MLVKLSPAVLKGQPFLSLLETKEKHFGPISVVPNLGYMRNIKGYTWYFSVSCIYFKKYIFTKSCGCTNFRYPEFLFFMLKGTWPKKVWNPCFELSNIIILDLRFLESTYKAINVQVKSVNFSQMKALTVIILRGSN